MKIGELAAKVGLSADTLRFYEKIHLIKPARLESGVRSYGQADEKGFISSSALRIRVSLWRIFAPTCA